MQFATVTACLFENILHSSSFALFFVGAESLSANYPRYSLVLRRRAEATSSAKAAASGDRNQKLPRIRPKWLRGLALPNRPDHPPRNGGQRFHGRGSSFTTVARADKSASWAEFRQRRSNGVTTYQAAFGTVYWKQDEVGRLIWTTGTSMKNTDRPCCVGASSAGKLRGLG